MKFNLASYFGSVLTLDDCLAAEYAVRKLGDAVESFSKPHPYMLDTIAEAHIDSISKCYYVGDMPDDMTAALRSKYGFTGIGFIASAPNEDTLARVLKKAGASHVIKDFDELPAILSQSN